MMQPKGKGEGVLNTSSVKQLSKITSTVLYIRCTAHLRSHCIYGTYFVLPVAEGLTSLSYLNDILASFVPTQIIVFISGIISLLVLLLTKLNQRLSV